MSDKHRQKGKRRRQIKNTAGYLANRLKEKGFIVQRYDSFSSNSIYLKLDYGTCHSMRISDHKGKKHLAYRYNILTCCPERIIATDQRGYVKYYVPMKDRDVLLQKIVYDRSQKVERWGLKGYQKFMEKDRKKGLKKKEVWQQARVV